MAPGTERVRGAYRVVKTLYLRPALYTVEPCYNKLKGLNYNYEGHQG